MRASKVEYGTVIWSPQYTNYKSMLESTQHKFLRYCNYKFNIGLIDDHDYSDILKCLRLLPLEKRRIVFDVGIIFKLLNGMMSCPYLLSKIGFAIPH